MSALGAFLALVLLAGSASAHDGRTHWGDFAETWTFDPRITIPLGLSAGLYALGLFRLWRRAGVGRGARSWQAGGFLAGWLLLAGALVTPLHWLGERLFTAHMVEHEVLMLLAAPLLVLARPIGAILWALPRRWRHGWGGLWRFPALAAVWRKATGPLAATALHGAAIWAWHIPALYAAALASGWVHWLQHACFLLSALLFWWAILRGRGRAYGIGVVCLFVTALHTGFLGVLITFARRPLYARQTDAAPDWGLTAMEDQQLAGLVMWVPGGMFYAAAALGLAGLWIGRSDSKDPGGSPHALSAR